MGQYLEVTKDMTLPQLANIVGERNVDYVLNANGVPRSVDVGNQFCTRDVGKTSVDYQKKIGLLNQFVGDSDVFERAALGSEDNWKSLSQYGCFRDAMKIPDSIKLPQSAGVLGNGIAVADKIYQDCIHSLKTTYQIDPTIFAEYNASYSSTLGFTGKEEATNTFKAFKIPFGDVCLYSSLGDEMLYFPVYPESIEDGTTANFEEMPEMLYQYEPWQVYKSSGPREISFTFEFHRDMWTGDHRDGNANSLVRACKANCYPDYDGSLVKASTVSLYIKGENFITGVMTSCKANWEKPIGLDGFYLKCTLSFTIKEVSPQALSYTVERNKGLIS